ncbi:glycosyltransferase family 2 protein [Burkholderia guangdongensis]|uniref:glycosyltransferase family 2 protein n=1 Tax=Burkholderia guangdongensis TaxID=1792500 RepID=UPI0015CE3755|nr:glycosyltransferase [Burkholderia guangdongensis]
MDKGSGSAHSCGNPLLHVVQTITLSRQLSGIDVDLYVRAGNELVHPLRDEHGITFEAGGIATFDTYFNALTVAPWKKYGRLDDLHLVLFGHGRYLIRFGVHRLGREPLWMDEQAIDVDGGIQLQIPVWPDLSDGILFFALESLTHGRIEGGHFATSTEPRPHTKLGIVITHFNRKEYVIPAIARIRSELLSDPLYRGKIDLAVIDNSSSIEPSEAAGVTVIPNRNVGGSGGFARGLLHFADEGTFTHCLFMDDDASCEIESIRRAYHLLSFCPPEARVAIAGSLMRERAPSVLHEKGGSYEAGNWIPVGKGLDMRNVRDLLEAEYGTKSPNFGAWWFFAFPIRAVRHYPFPFFVRGDDALFSLQNEFELVTLNGIGCWGEDFELKDGTFTRYFGFRGTSVVALLTLSERCITWTIFRQFTRWCLTALFSYNYASSQAVCCAMRDVLSGPQFFIDNVDTSTVRAQLARIDSAERARSVAELSEAVDYPAAVTERPSQTLLRWLTLNGLLLPNALMKDRTVVQKKAYRASFRQVFRYRAIQYEDDRLGVIKVAPHDKRAIIAGLGRYAAISIRVLLKTRSVQHAYRANVDRMTSERFWREHG